MSGSLEAKLRVVSASTNCCRMLKRLRTKVSRSGSRVGIQDLVSKPCGSSLRTQRTLQVLWSTYFCIFATEGSIKDPKLQGGGDHFVPEGLRQVAPRLLDLSQGHAARTAAPACFYFEGFPVRGLGFWAFCLDSSLGHVQIRLQSGLSRSSVQPSIHKNAQWIVGSVASSQESVRGILDSEPRCLGLGVSGRAWGLP